MQATTNRPKQISALTVAAVLTVTMLFTVAPSTADLGLPDFGEDDDFGAQSHGADILFDLSNFEQRGPVDHGSWAVTTTTATQTTSGEYATFLAADAGQVGGPIYQDVVFRSDITAPSVQNNIFGFAFGLERPTGLGTLVETYILDWGGEEQAHLGHTKPEGFTLYRIDGDMPADDGSAFFEDQMFACFWAKDDTACTSADITIIDEHIGVGTGWEAGQDYEISIRFEADTIRAFVSGGAYGGGQTVIDATGSYSPGEFALYSFRQDDVTFSNAGYNDDVAPTFELVDWCSGGAETAGWCTSAARFRVQNEEDLGSGVDTVECFVDGVSFGDCRTNTNVPGDGEFLVEAHVTDAAGNVAIETAILRQDTQLPELSAVGECRTIMFPSDWCRSYVTLAGSAEAASGIATTGCAVRADHLGETDFTDVICGDRFDTDGEWTLLFNATSVAGHYNETDEISFKLDTTAPVGEFITPAAGTSFVNGEEFDCTGIRVGITFLGIRTQTPTDCLAAGEIDVSVIAEDPIVNQYNTGIWKVEFWDGVGDNMFKIEGATIWGDGDGGFYNFTWDTSRAPSPSEPHFFQSRTLEVRIWDLAGNYEKLERTYFVLPPA